MGPGTCLTTPSRRCTRTAWRTLRSTYFQGVRQTQCGINCFILDSRLVLAPAPKGAGIRYQNTSQIQILLARLFETKGARCNLGLTRHLQVPAIL